MISVIVPVFKTEQYVEECIKSILAQTYTDFELILVDDGSPDNAGIICDRYAELDSRVKVIHKKNQGVSAARNEGIFQATGNYICFVDSDDRVDKKYLRLLFDNIEKGGMAACKMHTKGEAEYTSVCKKMMPEEAQVSVFSANGMGGGVGGKLYDAEIIRENRVLYDVNLAICEDLLFVIQYLQYAYSNVVWNYSTPYYYRPNQNGAVKGRFQKQPDISDKGLTEIIALENCRTYLLSDKRIERACKMRTVKAAVNTLRAMTANETVSQIDKRKLLGFVRKNAGNCIFSPYLTFSSKASICLAGISPRLEYDVFKSCFIIS